MSISLGVKARANKLNSPRINWCCRLSIGIRLFFRFNIVASKKYYLIIIGSLEVWGGVIYRHAAFSSAYSITET